MTMSGRGAWNKDGRGGTLQREDNGSTPAGRYYLLAVSPAVRVGSAARDAESSGLTPPLDALAVRYGVRAIQKLLNLSGASPQLSVDGVLGKGSDAGIRAYQTMYRLTVDGSVGPNTMKSLLLPHIKRIGGSADAGGQPWWTVVYGMLANEGGWDPGAVGVQDPNDLGLAQINGPSHPTYTEAQRFDPETAIRFNIDYLKRALVDLNGNLRDAVLSYNLGPYGVTLWIKAGRPRYWNPTTRKSSPVANTADGFRDTTTYIDRILNAYRELAS